MDDVTKIMTAFKDIGLSKERTLDIIFEVLSDVKYVNDEEAISDMIKSKLSIDEYISFTQYKVF